MIKTQEEIEKLRAGGLLLSKALGAALKVVKVGATMKEVDAVAERVMREGGGEPSFLGYKAGGDIPFPSTVCISRNDEVIHGLGNRDIAFEEGDIVGFDIGCKYEGLYTDMAMTLAIGDVDNRVKTLLEVTRASLKKGIEAIAPGRKLLAISAAVEQTIDPHGFGIVESYGGHGVGHAIHEDPFVPNFVAAGFKNPVLKEGMVLALEPMVTLGEPDLHLTDDSWTVATDDGSLAAHFEQTVVVTREGYEILTPFPEV